MSLARDRRLSGAAAAAVALGALLAARSAAAQMPVTDPSGRPPPAEPAAPSPPAGPTEVQPPPGYTFVSPVGTNPDGPPAADDGSQGFYHYDGLVDQGDSYVGVGNTAPVPETHVVRSGDTLWDICGFYFNNPWEWPRIWSYNPTITNPHWIYPGDLVRLLAPGSTPIIGDEPTEPGEPVIRPTPIGRRRGYELRQLAFVEKEQLENAILVDGAVEEHELLTVGDAIYLTYPAGKPPQVGKRYAVYSQTEPIRNPNGDGKIGAYVRLLGELEVTDVKQGKRAQARITDAYDVIQRGNRVGPVRRSFSELERVPGDRDLQATIAGMLGSDQIIGARQVVFLDKGKHDGLKPGNHLFVIRRGDAYQEVMAPSGQAGLNDERFPIRTIAELVVVEVGETTSVAVVISSAQEAEVGDHAILRKSR